MILKKALSKYIAGVFILSVAWALPAAAQLIGAPLPQDTVAVVGKEILTATDFLERFELMPWPQKENRSRHEYTKLEFLQSLVAEKLLSYEAAEKGIGTDTASSLTKYSTERLFSRDELYKREVAEKARITQDDIVTALERYAYDLRISVLALISRSEGDLLLKKIAASRNRDSTFASFRDSLYAPLDTIALRYGGDDLLLEDAAYALAVKQLSKPIELPKYGLVVLRLEKKVLNNDYSKMSRPDQVTHVQKIIRGRKEGVLANSYFASVMLKARAEADTGLFRVLADSAYVIMTADSLGHKKKNIYFLGPADLQRIRDHSGPLLQRSFVSMQGGPMTFAQLLENLQYNQIAFPSLEKPVVYGILNNNIKTVVQNEYLAREALKKNLQQSKQVRHDVGVWSGNRNARLLMQQVLDTVKVSECEILDYYKHNAELFGARVEVNVCEILTDSLELAQNLRKRVLAGESMASLAKKYSERKEWAARGGESGYFPITEHGDLGYYASSADSGQLIGPLKMREGFSLFTLLGKHEYRDSSKQSFELVTKQIETKLRREKSIRALDRYVGGLAKKYGVSMNEAALRRVQTTLNSMFTWRNIGFGGRIIAVPPVAPQSGWVQEWKRPSEINQ